MVCQDIWCDKKNNKNGILYECHFSVSINLSTRWQSAKKEVIFCEIVIVAVQRYCRERFRKKQGM
ncbi:MAG: hypothetical protein IJD36_03020, partial [Clostridia bacterium]|nr:hypothetical protein [Clostridia bacterium]